MGGTGIPGAVSGTTPVNMPSTAGLDTSKIAKVGAGKPAYEMAASTNKTPETAPSLAPANGMNLSGLPSWLTSMLGNASGAAPTVRPPNMTGTTTTLPAAMTPDKGNVLANPAVGGGMNFSGIPQARQSTYTPFNPVPATSTTTPKPPPINPIQLLDPNYKGPAPKTGNPDLNQWGMPKPKDFDYIDNLKLGDQKYSEIPTNQLMQFANEGFPAMNEYIAWRMGPYGGSTTPGVVLPNANGNG